MNHDSKHFKSLKIALKELEPFIRNGPIRRVLRFGENSVLRAYRTPGLIGGAVPLAGKTKEKGRVFGLSPHRSTK
jgi:hypothetical protein